MGIIIGGCLLVLILIIVIIALVASGFKDNSVLENDPHYQQFVSEHPELGLGPTQNSHVDELEAILIAKAMLDAKKKSDLKKAAKKSSKENSDWDDFYGRMDSNPGSVDADDLYGEDEEDYGELYGDN